jgi:adenosylcobinamide kinase/adenosylcobinamide-phosphate guanylyltransferase
MIIFVTGGARSGKSTFAQEMAENIEGKRLFIATAEAFDEEMKKRILKHKEQRGDRWDTLEEPIRIGDSLRSAEGSYKTVLVDCLTVWMSNILIKYSGRDEEMSGVADEFFSGLEKFSGIAIAVSNEVGMGIVPDNKLAREYRDRLGYLNQKMAKAADEVYFLCSGIPIKIK